MKIDKKIVGQRIRERRYHFQESLELSESEVIERLGFKRSTYTGWEIGHRLPSDEKLLVIAGVFNTTVDYLKGLTDDPNKKVVDWKEFISEHGITNNGQTLNEAQLEALTAVINSFMASK